MTLRCTDGWSVLDHSVASQLDLGTRGREEVEAAAECEHAHSVFVGIRDEADASAQCERLAHLNR